MKLKDKIDNAIWATGLVRPEQCKQITEAVWLALCPHDAVTDLEPLVCYFPDEAARNEFIAAVEECKPNWISAAVD